MDVFGVSRYLVAVFASYLLDASSSLPEISSDIVSYPLGMFLQGEQVATNSDGWLPEAQVRERDLLC